MTDLTQISTLEEFLDKQDKDPVNTRLNPQFADFMQQFPDQGMQQPGQGSPQRPPQQPSTPQQPGQGQRPPTQPGQPQLPDFPGFPQPGQPGGPTDPNSPEQPTDPNNPNPPSESPENPTEPTDPEEPEKDLNDFLGFENQTDSARDYVYKSVEIKVLDQVFKTGDDRLQNVVLTLGANDKTSTVSCTLSDPDLKIADIFFTKSRKDGGIKIPKELAGGSTAPPPSNGGGGNTFGGKTLTLTEVQTAFEKAVLKSSSGTYWTVTADGYCITAKHVKDVDGDSTQLTTKDGQTYTAKFVDEIASADVALYKCENASGLPINYLAPDISVYEDNTDPVIYTIGHGAKDGGGGRNEWYPTESRVIRVETVTQGTVQNSKVIVCEDDYNGKSFANSGNSGGPAYDHWGLAVGVVIYVASGGTQGPSEDCSSSALEYVKQILDKNSVTYTTGSREVIQENPNNPGNGGGGVDLENIPNGLKDDELAKVIIAYCRNKANITDDSHIAYILGTCEHESAMGVYTSEIDGENASYAPWYGRGLVQLTFRDNYVKAEEKLGLPSGTFTNNADLVSELKYAIPIMCLGMRDGWFTGVKLSDYGTGSSFDFNGARAIVNGTDRASTIAGYAQKWKGRLNELVNYNYQARVRQTPNDGSASQQLPNVRPPFGNMIPGGNQSSPDNVPQQPRPTRPGQGPSQSPNLPPSIPPNQGENTPQRPPNRFPQFPPDGGQPGQQPNFPELPGSDDPSFPGFPQPGTPNDPENPVNPQPGLPNVPENPNEPGLPNEPENPEENPPENPTETPAPTNQYNDIVVTLTTKSDKVITYKFILTDDNLSDIGSPVFTFNGKSIKYSLTIEDKTQNIEGATPSEAIQILAARNGIKVRNNSITTLQQRIDIIDQRNQTDYEILERIAAESNLTVVDDPTEDDLQLDDKEKPKTPKKVIITDIIELSFSDQGVVDEKPLYPVSLLTFTTEDILALKPEDSINLDNVYTFIPDSLKKDTWLINTITHDIAAEESRVELTKYIPVPQTATPGGGGGVAPGGGQLTEAQILEKYKSAVVKVGGASGCFVSADGYILTAAHMQGSTNIETVDGKKYTATEVDIDESTDIMLMKVSASGLNFAPIAPDTSIYTKGGKVPIMKIGHGITSEDGAGEGGNNPKFWDATTSFVREIANGFRGLTGKVVVADDKEIDFVNPGDSGCPWFDFWGLIVSCTSGGDRTHQEGAGKKDASWGGDVSAIITMLDKNNVAYTKGTRAAAPDPANPGDNDGNNGGGSGGDGKVAGWSNPAPGATMTSGFGPRNAPTQGASSNHKGIDLAAGDGSPILAASDGTVVDADRDTNGSGYGNYVVIKHAGNIGSLYGHCKELFVSVGDTVKRGDKIATEDNTGTSTGSHLHFGIAEGFTGTNIWSGATFVDPLNYISVNSSVALNDIQNFHRCIVDLDILNERRFRYK